MTIREFKVLPKYDFLRFQVVERVFRPQIIAEYGLHGRFLGYKTIPANPANKEDQSWNILGYGRTEAEARAMAERASQAKVIACTPQVNTAACVSFER